MVKSSYFDVHANEYDSLFSDSLIGKSQREIVHRYLISHFAENKVDSILELGCGTGEDALFFQDNGTDITISDPSIEMLERANGKLNSETEAWNLGAVETLKQSTKTYDLIFSNFGALNCLSAKELSTLSSLASQKLNPNGRLIVVFISKFCLWESLYFLLKLNSKKAFRRSSNKEFIIQEEGKSTSFWYYSIQKIKSLFPEFEMTKLKPVGSFIPPGYLSPFFERNKNLFDLLYTMEHASQSDTMARISDHTYFEFTKK